MDFVAIDIETANSASDSVCEIGAVKFSSGKEVHSWSSLVRPATSAELSLINFSKHGISQEQIDSAPSMSEIWEDFSSFVSGLPILAHNATQDINKLLSSVAADLDGGWVFPTKEYFCSLVLARKVEELVTPNYELRTIAEVMGLGNPDIARNEIVAHSAEADARTCGQIALELASMTGSRDMRELAKGLGVREGSISGTQISQRSVSKRSSTLWKTSAPNSEEYEAIKDELSEAGWGYKEHPLSGKTFVLTLGLDSLSDNDFVLACALIDAQLKTSVSGKLDYLVEGYDKTGTYEHGTTSKSKKARELNSSKNAGIEIIEEPKFLELLGSDVIDAVRELSKEREDAKTAKSLGVGTEDLAKRRGRNEATERKRAEAQVQMDLFLRDPRWTYWTLSPGHTICFTQLDYELEESLTKKCQELGINVIKAVTNDLDLLVIEDSRVDGSAKLRDSVIRGIDVTLLSVFLETNPKIATSVASRRKKRWWQS
jgi:DNA polymerase-3 subunit epsilon